METEMTREEMIKKISGLRINEICKLYEIEIPAFIETLNKSGEGIKSHMTKSNERIADKIIELFGAPKFLIDVEIKNIINTEVDNAYSETIETVNEKNMESTGVTEFELNGGEIRTSGNIEAESSKKSYEPIVKKPEKKKFERIKLHGKDQGIILLDSDITEEMINAIASKDIYRRSIVSAGLDCVHIWKVEPYKLYPLILGQIFELENKEMPLSIECMQYLSIHNIYTKFKSKPHVYKNEWRTQPIKFYKSVIELFIKYLDFKELRETNENTTNKSVELGREREGKTEDTAD